MALVCGFIALAAGMAGPVLFSSSNLGPLLGVFITAPVGTLLGALIGIMRSSREPGPDGLQIELWALGISWLFALAVTIFFIHLGGFLVVGPLCEALVLGAAGWLLLNKETRAHFSQAQRHCSWVLVAAGILVLTTAMLPPVTRRSQNLRQREAAEPAPRYAFILNSQFDASHRQPTLVVDQSALKRYWLVITVIAGGACAVVLALRGRRVRTG